MLIGETEIRDVHGIPKEQKQRIIDFLQGAVYCWCKNRKDEWFTTRDLLGGDNYFWQGTPLFFLYKKTENVIWLNLSSSLLSCKTSRQGCWMVA